MKPCHICEKIVRVEKSIHCLTCKRVFCYYCINTFFPERANVLLAKKENEPLPNLRISECFSCLKECKCYKCKSVENVVLLLPNNTAINQIQSAANNQNLVSEEELIPETGLFRGKKISELPLYLQRIYLKKKVLYSKHEISCLSNDKNIPEQQNNAEGDDKLNRIEEEKERKEIEESNMPNNEQQQNMKGEEQQEKNEQKGEIEDEEQADDYESEFPSRRAAHLQNQNSGINEADVEDQNDCEDPNADNEQQQVESMIDENGQNEKKRRQRVVEQALANRNDDSSIQQVVQ